MARNLPQKPRSPMRGELKFRSSNAQASFPNVPTTPPPHRLRLQPARHPMAPQRPHRHLHSRQLRGRQRSLPPGRRRPSRIQQRSPLPRPARPARPLQRILLRIRQPRRRLAHPQPAGQIPRPQHLLLLRPRYGAQPGSRPRRSATRPRSLRTRLPLGRISHQIPRLRSRSHPPNRSLPHGIHRRPPRRLVHPLRPQPSHPRTGSRRRRLHLRQRRFQRRPPLLYRRGRQTLAGLALQL